MPRKRWTEEQIIFAVKQSEAGTKAADICRELGVSQETFYTWKRRYRGIGVEELREFRQLRDESHKLTSAGYARRLVEERSTVSVGL